MSDSLDFLRDQRTVEQIDRLLEDLGKLSSSFDRYQFEGEIAHGGMGVVHRVFDRDTGRHLALKWLRGDGTLALDGEPVTGSAAPSEKADDPHRIVRFLDEARLTSQLDHPGIVPVHELGCDPCGRVYFTMKLVDGDTLRTVFEKIQCNVDGWSITRGLRVLETVCETLAYAHDQGVIHRDVKPGNVMVGRYGEVFVMDWGLARRIGSAPSGADAEQDKTSATDSTMRLPSHASDRYGTPSYMAPEQALGVPGALSPKVDVYSVGAMLYHLIARHAPFAEDGDSQTPSEILSRLRREPPRPLAQSHGNAPAELIAICNRAMARDPSERYHDANALRADLRAFLERRVVAAHHHGLLARGRKWVERNRALATCAAGCVILMSTVLTIAAARFYDAHRAAMELLVDARSDAARFALEAREARRRAELAEALHELDPTLGREIESAPMPTTATESVALETVSPSESPTLGR